MRRVYLDKKAGKVLGGIGDQEKNSKVDGGQLPRNMRLKGS